MNCSEWEIQHGNLHKKRYNCALGVNQKTGRLQWCPDSKISKMLIIVPVTLIPVVLVFVILSQLNMVGTVMLNNGDNNDGYPSMSNKIGIQNVDRSVDGASYKCVAIRYSMSETFDNKQMDLLKDVRTQFVPPDSLLMPAHCKGKLINGVDRPSIKRETQEESLNEFVAYIIRKRREITGLENRTIEESGGVVENSSNDREDDSSQNSESNLLKETDVTLNGDSQSFWKEKSSFEQIRAAQANIMLQYMDQTVEPCDDFYQYACGNWEKINPIPKDKAGLDTFEILRESLDTILNELLSAPERIDETEHVTYLPADETISTVTTIDPDLTTKTNTFVEEIPNTLEAKATERIRKKILRKRSTLRSILKSYRRSRRKRLIDNRLSNSEIKAKHLYKSCMNYELLKKRGISPLLELLKSLGGWPALDTTWNANEFDWLDLTARLRVYNNDIFLVQWVGPDIKKSEENVIQFDQTNLGLPTRDYFLQSSNLKYLEAYREYMTTIITLLGSSPEDAAKTANEIVLFEVELAKSTMSSEERTNVSVLYNKMTVETLHEAVPEIDWQRYLSIVQEKPINRSEVVIMFALGYMKNLVGLLAKTESKTVANYLLWRFVRHRISNLDDRFKDAKQKFYFVLFGREESPPRWKNCVNQVNTNMGMALGAMFVRKYFDENSKQDTIDMTSDIQQSFREILNATEWIDAPTKLLAEMKVNEMSLRIGYPDFILNHDELNDKYKDLSIDPYKYFENTLAVLVHLTRTEQIKLGEPVNKTAWNTAPAVVNAYYSRNQNQIMFPAGILQPPFYHRYFPKSLNYGGIGVVIGHELTHGFDDKGRLFDREGNLQRWWSDTSINGFHKRAKCLITQYGNYTVSEVGIPVDGENTQGENIADNGGIKQSFRAYTQWLANHQDAESLRNEVLPGINATNTQLFFLNFAQVWCGAMRPEASRNKLKTAVHSPGRFRVIGTLSNSVDFAREYNCKLGSPMNPENKCSVW